MRIGVDATCWSNARGYGRFARGLLSALLAAPSEHRYVFFVDKHTRQHCDMPPEAEYVVVPTSEAPTQAATSDGNRSIRDLWKMTNAVRQMTLDVMFFPSVYTYFPVI